MSSIAHDSSHVLTSYL